MLKNKFRALATGLTALTVAITALGPASVASARQFENHIGCAFQTTNGHYLTAVGGGGRTTDVIHTDAVRIGAWEKFNLIDSGDGTPITRFFLQTANGDYLTAVGGGGRNTDVIHSNATNPLDWEKFTLIFVSNGVYAIQTNNGHYLTAVGGGGRTTDTIHSDATQISTWEMFTLTCTN